MSPIIQQLHDQVSASTSVDESAVTFINGIQALIDAAVQQALDNGATAEQLQPLSDLSTAAGAESQALADAILAHTPQAPK